MGAPQDARRHHELHVELSTVISCKYLNDSCWLKDLFKLRTFLKRFPSRQPVSPNKRVRRSILPGLAIFLVNGINIFALDSADIDPRIYP